MKNLWKKAAREDNYRFIYKERNDTASQSSEKLDTIEEAKKELGSLKKIVSDSIRDSIAGILSNDLSSGTYNYLLTRGLNEVFQKSGNNISLKSGAKDMLGDGFDDLQYFLSGNNKLQKAIGILLDNSKTAGISIGKLAKLNDASYKVIPNWLKPKGKASLEKGSQSSTAALNPNTRLDKKGKELADKYNNVTYNPDKKEFTINDGSGRDLNHKTTVREEEAFNNPSLLGTQKEQTKAQKEAYQKKLEKKEDLLLDKKSEDLADKYPDSFSYDLTKNIFTLKDGGGSNLIGTEVERDTLLDMTKPELEAYLIQQGVLTKEEEKPAKPPKSVDTKIAELARQYKKDHSESTADRIDESTKEDKSNDSESPADGEAIGVRLPDTSEQQEGFTIGGFQFIEGRGLPNKATQKTLHSLLESLFNSSDSQFKDKANNFAEEFTKGGINRNLNAQYVVSALKGYSNKPRVQKLVLAIQAIGAQPGLKARQATRQASSSEVRNGAADIMGDKNVAKRLGGSKRARLALARDMEQSKKSISSIDADGNITIDGTTYGVKNIGVLTGSRKGNADGWVSSENPQIFGACTFRNAVIKDDVLYAQMKNGCEGNLVVAKLGPKNEPTESQVEAEAPKYASNAQIEGFKAIYENLNPTDQEIGDAARDLLAKDNKWGNTDNAWRNSDFREAVKDKILESRSAVDKPKALAPAQDQAEKADKPSFVGKKLKKGMEGLREFQQALKEAGIKGPRGKLITPDGKWGPQMRDIAKKLGGDGTIPDNFISKLNGIPAPAPKPDTAQQPTQAELLQNLREKENPNPYTTKIPDNRNEDTKYWDIDEGKANRLMRSNKLKEEISEITGESTEKDQGGKFEIYSFSPQSDPNKKVRVEINNKGEISYFDSEKGSFVKAKDQNPKRAIQEAIKNTKKEAQKAPKQNLKDINKIGEVFNSSNIEKSGDSYQITLSNGKKIKVKINGKKLILEGSLEDAKEAINGISFQEGYQEQIISIEGKDYSITKDKTGKAKIENSVNSIIKSQLPSNVA